MLKKILSTPLLNTIFGVIASVALVLQDINIGMDITLVTKILYILTGSVSGSFLGEAFNLLISKNPFSWRNALLGVAISIVLSILILVII